MPPTFELLSGYVEAEYAAAIQDARGLATQAAGLLAANGGVLAIAATIAPSARDAGGRPSVAVTIAL